MDETMRHSKLAPFAARVASHDSVLGGHKVPKNVSCYYISMPVLLILLMNRRVNLINYPGIIIIIYVMRLEIFTMWVL